MPTAADYEQLARDFVQAFDTREAGALQRLNTCYRRSFTFDDLAAEVWRRVYAHRQRFSRGEPSRLLIAEAQTLVAQDAGYPSWTALLDAVAHGTPALPAFAIDTRESSISPRRQLADADWDALISAMSEHRITAFDAGGLMTDAALARLAALPHVTSLSLAGSRQLTDEGLRHLAAMPQLQHLNLSGAKLTFTNEGLATLARPTGLTELDLFWHATSITSDGFTHLATLPNFRALGADGALSDDRAMQHYAAMPVLRKLRAQEAAATDTGFEALAQSKTLESVWGRECGRFGDRGFRAFARLATLRELGIGCRNVSDAALAAFPEFPLLQSLTPIGVTDAGFRHIGRCMRIERLTCMYCRETTDAATAHITDLPLRYYYAGLTQITDRSLELLGRIRTLEQVEFYEVNGITDAGLPHLASLPRLREVALDSSPGVTLDGTRVFPAHVRVRYST